MKQCVSCDEVKDATSFNRRRDSKDGLQSNCRDCQRSIKRHWANENKAHVIAYNRSWDASHREVAVRRMAAWRERNPEAARLLFAKVRQARRARLRDSFVEHVDHIVVFERDAWVCGICGGAISRQDASLDHIIPLARGGEHSYANVQASHLSCNVRKQAR